ncbi:MAG: creatininase family protein [Bacteroidales bacterium]|nr:creatininase family protein [Bacteroidales bacterium]
MRPYILSETNYQVVKNGVFEIAILPWGATEAHNYHLPYGTDNYETEDIAAESAKKCWEKNVKCLVLPVIPYGVNTGQSDIPGTMNVYPSTQAVILHDILESVWNSGIKKFVILNGHGGNDFKQMLREAGREFPELFLASANWFQSVDKTTIFENDGDHADEMETSLMLHLHSELVLPLDKAGSGKNLSIKAESLKQGWNWTERKWTKVTKDTGIGDPSKASPNKGKIYFEEVTEKFAALLLEIAALDVNNMYTE